MTSILSNNHLLDVGVHPKQGLKSLCFDIRPKPGLKPMYFGTPYCHLSHVVVYTDTILPEGDGARSFSELVILKALMSELRTMKYPEEPDKVMLPCEEFSMIGGRGTGG